MQNIFGVFLDEASAESAAQALRRDGFRVATTPVAESNPAAFPFDRRDVNSQFLVAAVSAPLGLAVGASLGILTGALLTSVVTGILITPMFGFVGAMLGLWLSDRPASHFTELAKQGSLLLTVRCADDQEASVMGALKDAHALEVGAVALG